MIELKYCCKIDDSKDQCWFLMTNETIAVCLLRNIPYGIYAEPDIDKYENFLQDDEDLRDFELFEHRIIIL